MNSPEETSAGPVIRDLRRIDPRTGQVRNPGPGGPDAPGAAAPAPGKGARPGRHAASKPGSTAGGGAQGDGPRPASGAEPGAEPGAGQGTGNAGQGTGNTAQGTGNGAGSSESDLKSELAERTADLQRVTAEYANYRKRVDRDRMAVREQALANVLGALLPVLDDIGRAREHGELTGGFKSVAESLESIVTKLGLGSFGTEGEPFDPRVHEALAHSYSTDVTEATCVQILQPGYKVGERILRPARVAVAEPDDGAAAAGAAGGPAAQAGDEAGSQEHPQDED